MMITFHPNKRNGDDYYHSFDKIVKSLKGINPEEEMKNIVPSKRYLFSDDEFDPTLY